jgi:hypothetical protein
VKEALVNWATTSGSAGHSFECVLPYSHTMRLHAVCTAMLAAVLLWLLHDAHVYDGKCPPHGLEHIIK